MCGPHLPLWTLFAFSHAVCIRRLALCVRVVTWHLHSGENATLCVCVNAVPKRHSVLLDDRDTLCALSTFYSSKYGTHVAGTIAGRTFGVAKQSRIVGLKVLNRNGKGLASGVLAALEWVVQQARTNGGTTIANMSLGGRRSEAENQAIAAATRAGVLIVAAAGNESQDACKTSPASAPSALTVAASNSRDRLDSYSNYGRCVDIIAPGGGIVSATPDGGSAANSGTSMATAHVAGAAALILASNPRLTPARLTTEIINRSTRDEITGTLRNTPNRLLYIAPQ